MPHQHYGSPDDLNDTGLPQLGDGYLLSDSTEESWNPLVSAIDGQYCVDQAANASIGQHYNTELASATRSQFYTNDPLANSSSGYHTTPYSSQLPSFHTGPTSEETSLEDLSAHRLLDEAQMVDLSKSQDTLQPQDDVLFGIDPRHLNLPIAQDLSDDLPANVPVPSAHSENSEGTIAPASRSVLKSQRELAQGSASSSHQEVDNAVDIDGVEDRVEADLMRLLTQISSLERGVRMRDRLCGKIDARLDCLRGQVQPQPGPSIVNKTGPDKQGKPIDRSLLYWRCTCGFESQNIHVFKRHVDDMHYPQMYHHCHHEDGHCTALRKPYRRRDKIVGHYRVHHKHVPPDAIINQRRVMQIPPVVCALCPRTVGNWAEFYACFMDHCAILPGSSNVGSSQTDGHDRANKKRKFGPDRDEPDGGAGTGGPALSQQNHRHTGNAPGQRQHQSTSGPSSNQMSNGDARPLLQGRSAPDGCDGRTKGSRPKPARPSNSNPQLSGSGGGPGSGTKGPSKKKGSQPQLDPRHLQGQAPSQPPVDKCKSCPHIFSDCPRCCNNPPSGNWCHECPLVKQAQAMQARNPMASRASGNSAINSQAWGFPNAQFDPQGFHGASMEIPVMTRANPVGYAAMQQRPQPSQPLRQQRQAQGMGPYMNTQLGFFGGSSFYPTNVVHDIQVRGMSELEMETSIMDSKSKLDPKKTQASNCWSVVLPFRGSLQPLRKPLLGMTSTPASVMGTIARKFIGPVPLSKANPSSVCRCACRTRSQGTYFARGRMDIAGGRRIELDFKMAPEAHGTGHPLRTRIQVVVKMLRLRSSATRSASAKHKQEAHDAIKEVLEATLNGSETTTITYEDEAKVVDLDNSDYDSDAESAAESVFSSSCSRVSSCTDLTQFSSPPSSPPPLTYSRTPTCSDHSLPSPHSSPELSACPLKSSCKYLELPAPARSSLPFRQNGNDDTLSSEQHSVHDVEAFEEEEKELELTFDLDLKSSLDMLARWTGVPTDDLRSSVSVWDPDRVFRYIMNHLLFVIFSLARSRDNDPNPCWDRKRSSPS